jgi:hypothetical protein
MNVLRKVAWHPQERSLECDRCAVNHVRDRPANRDRATRRLAELLNAGRFEVVAPERDEDRYGRKLRVLVRNGQSLGDQLVAEGLARTWEGRRRPWC